MKEKYNLFWVVLTPCSGYTLLDIVAKVKGHYIPVTVDTILHDYTPKSAMQDACVIDDQPSRMHDVVSTTHELLESLTQQEWCWRYVISE